MTPEYQRKYRENMTEYQKQKLREYFRLYHQNQSPEKKAEKRIKNQAWYQANKERVNKYQMERYYRLKEKKNECEQTNARRVFGKLSGRKNKKEVVGLTISTLEGNECQTLDGGCIKYFIGHIPKAQ